MQMIRISKRHRPASWRLEPQSADPRDPDIVRAKQLVGRSRPAPLLRRTSRTGRRAG